MGLMPETQRKARNAAAAEERRLNAVAERRRVIEQRREEEQKQRETAAKATAGSSKPKRTRVARKASKPSGLGEEVSISESESAADAQGSLTKSELAKREANAAWAVIQKGRAPLGYVLVSTSTFAGLNNC